MAWMDKARVFWSERPALHFGVWFTQWHVGQPQIVQVGRCDGQMRPLEMVPEAAMSCPFPSRTPRSSRARWFCWPAPRTTRDETIRSSVWKFAFAGVGVETFASQSGLRNGIKWAGPFQTAPGGRPVSGIDG